MQVLGLPAMADDWDEGTLTWSDVPNLKPLSGDDVINATRHNFIRRAHRAVAHQPASTHLSYYFDIVMDFGYHLNP